MKNKYPYLQIVLLLFLIAGCRGSYNISKNVPNPTQTQKKLSPEKQPCLLIIYRDAQTKEAVLRLANQLGCITIKSLGQFNGVVLKSPPVGKIDKTIKTFEAISGVISVRKENNPEALDLSTDEP